MGGPPAPDSAATSLKKRAACDECRTRKLKCSGERPRCERCRREGVPCVYSAQKQMGRPRKRRREEMPEDEFAADADGDADFDALATISFDNLQLQPDHLHLSDEDSGVGLGNLQNEDLLGALQQPGAPYISLSEDPTFPVASNEDFSSLDGSVNGSMPCPVNSTMPGISNLPCPQMSADPTPAAPPCGCLANLYLTLSDLQTLTSFGFPFVLPHLRSAASVADGVIDCTVCPESGASIMQNTFMVSTLLSAIAERTARVLREVNEEADRVKAAGATKPFRMGDMSPGSEKLHTGTLDCPVGFNVDLGPQEWRTLAKKVVKSQFYGQTAGAVSVPGLVERLRDRQTRWHSDPEMEKKHRDLFGLRGNCRPDGTGEYTCLRMVRTIQTMVEGLEWE